jgi:hypothetical protein
VDELRIISFDRFQMKLPSSVQYDDLVRVHLNYFKHYKQKVQFLKADYGLPDICKLPIFLNSSLAIGGVSEDRPIFYPTNGRYY